MGLFGWIGKGIKKGVELAKGKPKQKSMVRAIIPTNYPESYAYYYESMGHKTDSFIGSDGRSYLVVWEKGLKEKEINDFVTKLNQVI